MYVKENFELFSGITNRSSIGNVLEFFPFLNTGPTLAYFIPIGKTQGLRKTLNNNFID